MNFLLPSSTATPTIPATPPAAMPASMANTSIAQAAASQRSKAAAAAMMAGGGANPDLAASPSTAKSALLGAT